MTTYSIRKATGLDTDAILELLPRLADFDLPPGREPEELWGGDRDLMLAWNNGEKPQVTVFVAVDSNDRVVGTAIVTLCEELLSHKPSAHLEVLALDKAAEGHGLGKALVAQSEEHAKENGALSITLHVFSSNTRARGLYEQAGFKDELMRYSKTL